MSEPRPSPAGRRRSSPMMGELLKTCEVLGDLGELFFQLDDCIFLLGSSRASATISWTSE